MSKLICFFCIATFLSSCSGTQIEKGLEIFKAAGPINPSLLEIQQGLKEALNAGISKGATTLSQSGGYLNNLDVKIPFPTQFQKVEKTLRKIGLSALCDKSITLINKAAENAATESLPIFKQAIFSMTLSDAKNILFGEKNAATNFLKKTTGKKIAQKFSPIIQVSLDKVHASKAWEKMISHYNRIPFIQKINPDLVDYTTSKAIDGLFFMVAKKEAEIRKDPISRTTDLLKKVFSYAMKKN